MNILLKSIATILQLLIVNTSFSDTSENSKKDFKYLIANFTTFYRDDYSGFGEIFNTQAKKATSCESISEVARFFEVAPQIRGNAEMHEWFSEVIENLMIYNPACFLDAALKTSEAARHKIIVFISEPTFKNYEDFRKALSPYKDNEKYREIISKMDIWDVQFRSISCKTLALNGANGNKLELKIKKNSEERMDVTIIGSGGTLKQLESRIFLKSGKKLILKGDKFLLHLYDGEAEIDATLDELIVTESHPTGRKKIKEKLVCTFTVKP
ncbi:MAG: hypothetical protein AB8G05_12900 [Oligoflexales bacterium]